MVWLSKFSTIRENPASSTEGSFGFRRFHLSKPTAVSGLSSEHGNRSICCKERIIWKILSVQRSNPKCRRPVVSLGVEMLSTSGNSCLRCAVAVQEWKRWCKVFNLSAKWAKLDAWVVQILLPFCQLGTSYHRTCKSF